MNVGRPRVVNALCAVVLAIIPLALLTATAAAASVLTNTPVAAPNAFTAVSCPTSTFCAAVDNQGNAFTYDSSSNTWSLPVNLEPATAITALSCASSSFCMAGDLNGNTYVYDGTSWAVATQPDGSTVTGVSCTLTPASCMAVTDNGNAFTTSDAGVSWVATPVPDGAALGGVSCVSATSCVVIDVIGNAFTYEGGAWLMSPVSTSSLTSVSCVTATFCAAVDIHGDVFTYNGSMWSAALQNPIVTVTGPTGLTCTTDSHCLIGDANGNIYVDTDGTWTADPANPVDSGGGVTALSCFSVTSCIVGDNAGDALVYIPPPLPTVRSPLPQSTLDVTTVSGTVGAPLTLAISGGSGTGAITFQVTAVGSAECVLSSATTLAAASVGTCTVTATKASDGTYAAVSSLATQVTFVAPPPPPPAKTPPVTRPRLITRVVGPFSNGSFALSHSLFRAVDALALAAQRNHDHQVIVTGYASATGTLAQNEKLSLARARVVAAALRAACADRHYAVTITATGRGVGSAPTPAADRVVDVTLH